MPHVFISYSNQNKTTADELCAVLERNGLRCWIAPRDIPPGSAWPETIVSAIGDSQLMITVVSQDAYRSEHMARELGQADTNRIPILPVRLDGTPLKGQFQYFLGNKQWLDLRDRSPDDDEAAVVNAVRTLQARWDRRPAGSAHTQPTLSPVQPDATSHPLDRRRPRRGVDTIVDEVRDVIMTFVAVAMRRQQALADFNLSDSRTLFFAFRFLIYLSLASAILHIPAWSAQEIRFGHPAFMPLVLAVALIEQIAVCFVLYSAIRLFGSTGGSAAVLLRVLFAQRVPADGRRLPGPVPGPVYRDAEPGYRTGRSQGRRDERTGIDCRPGCSTRRVGGFDWTEDRFFTRTVQSISHHRSTRSRKSGNVARGGAGDVDRHRDGVHAAVSRDSVRSLSRPLTRGALMAAVAADARRRGLEFVWWVSRTWNTESHAFFRTLATVEEPVIAFATFGDQFTRVADEGD